MTDPSRPVSGRPGIAGRLRRLVPRPARRALRHLATWPERSAHAGRRQRANARLRALVPVRSVLVLCHGNICRSPFVALRMEERWGEEGPRVDSAGFFRGGRPSPIEAKDAARKRGIDLDAHRSRQVTAQDLEDFDLIIVMEPEQRAKVLAMAPTAGPRVLVLGEVDPAPLQTALVPDPWGHPPAVFDACYVRLDRCVDALLETLDPG